MAKFSGANGKPVMRSTKELDRKRAQKIAEDWESASRKARRSELTQSASQQILSDLLEHSRGEKLAVSTVRHTLTDYLISREKVGRAKSTASRYESIIKGFLIAIGKTRADANVLTLGIRDIERWRDSEIHAGKTPKTVNMGLSIIRAALAAAKRRGELLANPAEAVERVAGSSEEREPFSDQDLHSIIKAAGGTDWRTAILFGAWTGLRLADIVALTWQHVDDEGGMLRVTAKKTGRRSAIAIAAELAHHLRSIRPTPCLGPITPSLAGRASGSNGKLGGLSNEFRRLMKRAGVDPVLRSEKKGKGRRFSGKSFHSLRHTFVTKCAMAGAGESITKSMTGHSTESAFRRYVHLGVEAQRTVLDRLPLITEMATSQPPSYT